MAGDAGAEDLRPGIVHVSRERILGRAGNHRLDRLAAQGIPAPDHPVGTPGKQGAIVGKERKRPYGQPWPDQGAKELA